MKKKELTVTCTFLKDGEAPGELLCRLFRLHLRRILAPDDAKEASRPLPTQGL